MKDLVRAYGGFEITAGEFSVYSELQMKDGAIAGYVKPLFQGVEVGTDGAAVAEKGLHQRLYEGLVGIGTKVLKNRLRERSRPWSRSPGEWTVRRAPWETVGRLLQNAFLKPIEPGFEPQRRPSGRPTGSAAPEARDRPAQQTGPPASTQAP